MNALSKAFRSAGVVSSSGLYEIDNILHIKVKKSADLLNSLGMYRFSLTKNRMPGRPWTSSVKECVKPSDPTSRVSGEFEKVMVPSSDWFYLANQIKLPVLSTYFLSAEYVVMSVKDFVNAIEIARENSNLEKFDLAWLDKASPNPEILIVRIMWGC